MFILAIGDRGRASSRLRVWDHVSHLRRTELKLHIDSVVPMVLARRKAALLLRLLLRYPLWCFWFLQAKKIFIQETLILWPLVCLLAKPMKKTIVFDFSDPIDSLGSGFVGRMRHYGFKAMIRHSSHVIVENPVYQKELPRSDVYQFYGPVDTVSYGKGLEQKQNHPKSPGSPIRIGWTGSPGTLKFISPLFEHLDKLAEELNIELILIGISEHGHVFRKLNVTCLPWNEKKEFIEVPRFDLGLHALDHSPESLKRGAGKIFIYMASGVPFITDGFGIGACVVKKSNAGVLVSDKNNWRESLKSILKDESLRNKYSELGLSFSRKYMSYDKYRDLLKFLFY
jgi:glycosyltransferase involved in cell wall biosynthesis